MPGLSLYSQLAGSGLCWTQHIHRNIMFIKRVKSVASQRLKLAVIRAAKVYLFPIGSLYDFAPAARAVIWFPIQIPKTGWGRSLCRTFEWQCTVLFMTESSFKLTLTKMSLATVKVKFKFYKVPKYDYCYTFSHTFWTLSMRLLASDGSPGPLEMKRPS